MGNTVLVTHEAKAKLSDAFQWYESKRTGLGHEFLGAFSDCFALIQRQPEIFPEVRGYRKGLPRKFPYLFFYRFEDGIVTVYQIFHSSENPQKWTRGLQRQMRL